MAEKSKLNVLTLGTYFLLLSVCSTCFGAATLINNSNIVSIIIINFSLVFVFMTIIFKKLLFNSPNAIYAVFIFNICVAAITILAMIFNNNQIKPDIIIVASVGFADWKAIEMTKNYVKEEKQKAQEKESAVGIDT